MEEDYLCKHKCPVDHPAYSIKEKSYFDNLK
jgi:hypothetical protein